MLVYDELLQKVFLHRKTVLPDANLKDDGTEMVFEQKEEPLGLEIQHFVDCMTNRDRPLSDVHNGVAVVKVLAEISNCLGREV